jgi:hypothetical protein
MIETIVFCDCCRVAIPSGRTRLSAEGGTIPSWPADPTTGRPSIALCSGCLGELVAWLSEAVRPGPDPRRPGGLDGADFAAFGCEPGMSDFEILTRILSPDPGRAEAAGIRFPRWVVAWPVGGG